MGYLLEKYKSFKQAYDEGFKTNIMTVFMYIILSSAWIIWSDDILEKVSVDFAMYGRIQSLKGLFFVIMTSIFLFVFLWRNYNTIIKIRKLYEKSEIELKEFKKDINPKNELYYIMTKFVTNDDINIDEILVEIFRYIFNKIEVCDFGSVFRIGENSIHYVDAIGFDLKSLNSINRSPDGFELFVFDLKNDKIPEKKLRERLGAEKYEKYTSENPPMHESMYIGLVDNFDIKLGISLDISESSWEDNRVTFDVIAINEMKELQLLVSAMFRMKRMISVKDLIQRDIVNSFIVAMDYHDEYTRGHSETVAKISVEVGKILGLEQNELQELHWAATVHDIGKIAIPILILNKKGALTDSEYDIVKKHPTIGEDLLSRSESLRDISKYVRHHHEHWDGNGYPDGLVGEEIPYYSRIIGVSDAYHAMTSDRSYRNGLEKSTAVKEILKNKGRQFCPIVVDAFIKSID